MKKGLSKVKVPANNVMADPKPVNVIADNKQNDRKSTIPYVKGDIRAIISREYRVFETFDVHMESFEVKAEDTKEAVEKCMKGMQERQWNPFDCRWEFRDGEKLIRLIGEWNPLGISRDNENEEK